MRLLRDRCVGHHHAVHIRDVAIVCPSHEQIRDAFRAAQYTPEEVEAYASAVELRIAELNQLWEGSTGR